MFQSLVVVVHRHRQGTFSFLLTYHVVVEVGFDVQRSRQALFGAISQGGGGGQLIAHDVVAQINAFVANEYRRTCDQLFDLVLAFAAKGAEQVFLSA